MKITSACIYPLHIPFVETFAHHLSSRRNSDSLVVKVTTDTGVCGYGEGVPRPYVTGETQESSCNHVKTELLPRILGVELDALDLACSLRWVSGLLRGPDAGASVTWNTARCAVELAIIDCLFRAEGFSVNQALPPVADTLTYSGVITGGSYTQVEKAARRCRDAQFQHVKMKVCREEDAHRVASVRDILGPSVSLRLDANAAFQPDAAIRFLASVAEYDIACIEQPIPRGDLAELAAIRSASPIPVMADESLVTIEDAHELIEANAVDYFNLRLSKCGGLHRTLAIADIAEAGGIRVQLGCQVGETAILSAAGRHLAAHMKRLEFLEGSYGTHLLVEDLSEDEITFGPGGDADVLTGDGLGITVREEILDKYAGDPISVQGAGPWVSC